VRGWVTPLGGALLLWALMAPAVDAAGHPAFAWWPPRLLLLLMLGVALLALAGRRVARPWRALAAIALLALAALPPASAAVHRALERDLDLYFDLRHVPSLIGLAEGALGRARMLAIGGAALVVLAAAVALVTLALGAVERGLARAPRIAAAVAVAALALVILPVGGSAGRADGLAVRQIAQAWRAWSALHRGDPRYAAALASPMPAPRPLPGLAGHDVYLVFIESYGTLGLDEPRLHRGLAPALARFAAAAAAAGYGLVSSRLLSPTYGGGSWLAHGTIDSGVKLDQLLYDLLTRSRRLSLARYFKAAGYRAVDVMPGTKTIAADVGFWGFDRHYYAADLGYAGPDFGWFGIPDQYALARFTAREVTPGHPPLFAQIVLVSSHAPFVPVPPYLADWSDAGTFASVAAAAWPAVRQGADGGDFAAAYVKSLAYDFTVLGAWLQRLPGAPLVIMLGDHQPPGLAPAQPTPWTVPVYALSRDPALLAPFRALGYGDGAEPPPAAAAKGMESFLGDFLAAFSQATAAR
jgi:hypothetical protein